MKKIICNSIVTLLLCTTYSYAITPADCEINGEIIFTRECINQMLTEKEQEKPAATQDNSKEITLLAPQNETVEQPANSDNKAHKVSTTSGKSPPPANEEAETIVADKPFRCSDRNYFKAVEAQDNQYFQQCPITKSQVDKQDLRAEKKGRTALHWAVLTKNYALINQLLDEDANLLIKSQADIHQTPLHLAVRDEDITSTNLLLQPLENIDYSVGINARNLLKETPLHVAVKTQNIKIIESVINAGADIEARDRTGKTPLLTASLYAGPETIDLLIQHGAKIDVITRQGNSPLHYSALTSYETTKTLLEHGAVRNNKNYSGETPLEKVQNHHLSQYADTIKLLQTYKNKTDTTVRNLLLTALQNNNLAEFSMLLDNGYSPASLTLEQIQNKPAFITLLKRKGWLTEK